MPDKVSLDNQKAADFEHLGIFLRHLNYLSLNLLKSFTVLDVFAQSNLTIPDLIT